LGALDAAGDAVVAAVVPAPAVSDVDDAVATVASASMYCASLDAALAAPEVPVVPAVPVAPAVPVVPAVVEAAPAADAVSP
jgi:hypothetical protein